MAGFRFALFLPALSALFWSGNFVIGRAFAGDIPPITLAFFRWSLAALVFFPLGATALFHHRRTIWRFRYRLLFMGLFGVAGFNTFAYIGLQTTTATNALLINSFIPILILLLARIYPGDRIGILQLAGIVTSTLGMLVLVYQGDWQAATRLQVNQGDLWILLAALVWAVYSISLRWRPASLSSDAFLLTTMLIGVTVLLPFFVLNVANEQAVDWTRNNLLAVGYVALFASIGAYLCWNQGVKVLGAGTAGQFIHLMPVFGSILAVLFLDEHLQGYHFAGAVLIAIGIWLSVSQGKRC